MHIRRSKGANKGRPVRNLVRNTAWNNFFILYDCKVPNLPKQWRTLLTRNFELSVFMCTHEELLAMFQLLPPSTLVP